VNRIVPWPTALSCAGRRPRHQEAANAVTLSRSRPSASRRPARPRARRWRCRRRDEPLARGIDRANSRSTYAARLASQAIVVAPVSPASAAASACRARQARHHSLPGRSGAAREALSPDPAPTINARSRPAMVFLRHDAAHTAIGEPLSRKKNGRTRFIHPFSKRQWQLDCNISPGFPRPYGERRGAFRPKSSLGQCRIGFEGLGDPTRTSIF